MKRLRRFKAQNAKITDAMSKKVIPAKQEIISEGTTGDCMYIIEAGEVQVFKVSPVLF